MNTFSSFTVCKRDTATRKDIFKLDASYLWNVEKLAPVWFDEFTAKERPQLKGHKKSFEVILTFASF